MDLFSDENVFDVFEGPPTKRARHASDRDVSDSVQVEEVKDEQFADPDADATFGEYKEQVVRDMPIEGCTHEIAYPPAFDVEAHLAAREANPDPRNGEAPAKTYAYTLDPFQAVSVDALERSENVLVAAHTSAGKTTVAEYAVALALKRGARVIYTSPIKALSNQKFRELQEEFGEGEVGLMTGDVTICPSASCLVMTTEILRSMLYRGSEVVREVAFVVFDEVHYMRDRERGVVWEETIILLPRKVRMVFLSATIPNAREFALWVAKLNAHPCHVVYTDYRPTPLQHYVFPAGGNGLHLVVDDRGVFRADAFREALAVLTGGDEAKAQLQELGKKKRERGRKETSDVPKIVKMVMAKKYHPLIVFSFAKKECERHATALHKLDFNSDEEKEAVSRIFASALDSLGEDDKQLPQVVNMLPLLRRGIGIHHGGLLPILKEVTELLFQEGLVKCLFATETFAMGLNMPAKTVVFTNCHKFDGKKFRPLGGGEYIQMAGRAGRRGLDDRGVVIMMIDKKLDNEAAKTMLQGTAEPLRSSFHLSYNMLLNLLRVEEHSAEYMIARSFQQFQATRAAPELRREAQQLRQQRAALCYSSSEDERDAEAFLSVRAKLELLGDRFRQVRNLPLHMLPFCVKGRLVQLDARRVSPADSQALEWDWGVLLGFDKRPELRRGRSDAAALRAQDYRLEVLVYGTPVASSDSGRGRVDAASIRPVQVDGDTGSVATWHVATTSLDCLREVSSVIVKTPAQTRVLREAPRRAALGDVVRQVKRRFKGTPPLLDPIGDMGIREPSFAAVVRKIEKLEHKLSRMPLAQPEAAERLQRVLPIAQERLALSQRIKDTERRAEALSRNRDVLSNLRNMKRVLRRLGLVNEDNVVDVKGRVACSISTADELVSTELLFGGAFNSLDAAQVAALCSCLVCTEGKAEEGPPRLSEHLAAPYRVLRETLRRVAKVCAESGLELDEKEFVERFKPQLMEVVAAWCTGAKFADIMRLTEGAFEGSVIRSMRRLEELLAQFVEAAGNVGNQPLADKFADAIKLIKRDIVFAGSLYL